ncbi:kinesin-like protein [Klebsormidium nitens]|uniref:Kinesin-like protein n=1 Tax=Klebsormidium nitens TaxID=105231 RepID=A0A1Y1IBU0_KLENI|nr:kinesin-like protein [Klebsormidium nitens]|eukprot:GAQ86176.1 kinesin-like protein [Klebsormidium nitens]
MDRLGVDENAQDGSVSNDVKERIAKLRRALSQSNTFLRSSFNFLKSALDKRAGLNERASMQFSTAALLGQEPQDHGFSATSTAPPALRSVQRALSADSLEVSPEKLAACKRLNVGSESSTSEEEQELGAHNTKRQVGTEEKLIASPQKVPASQSCEKGFEAQLLIRFESVREIEQGASAESNQQEGPTLSSRKRKELRVTTRKEDIVTVQEDEQMDTPSERLCTPPRSPQIGPGVVEAVDVERRLHEIESWHVKEFAKLQSQKMELLTSMRKKDDELLQTRQELLRAAQSEREALMVAFEEERKRVLPSVKHPTLHRSSHLGNEIRHVVQETLSQNGPEASAVSPACMLTGSGDFTQHYAQEAQGIFLQTPPAFSGPPKKLHSSGQLETKAGSDGDFESVCQRLTSSETLCQIAMRLASWRLSQLETRLFLKQNAEKLNEQHHLQAGRAALFCLFLASTSALCRRQAKDEETQTSSDALFPLEEECERALRENLAKYSEEREAQWKLADYQLVRAHQQESEQLKKAAQQSKLQAEAEAESKWEATVQKLQTDQAFAIKAMESVETEKARMTEQLQGELREEVKRLGLLVSTKEAELKTKEALRAAARAEADELYMKKDMQEEQVEKMKGRWSKREQELEAELAELRGRGAREEAGKDSIPDAASVTSFEAANWEDERQTMLAEQTRVVLAAQEALESTISNHEQEKREMLAEHARALEEARAEAEEWKQEKALLLEKRQKELSQAVTEATARLRGEWWRERENLEDRAQQSQRLARTLSDDVERKSAMQAAMQRKLSRLEADMITLAIARKTAEEAAQKAEGELAAAVEKYKAEWNERKRIYNQLQELRGNIRVFCRIRPLLPDEVTKKQPSSVTLLEGHSVAVLNPATTRSQTFDFDRVLGEHSSQAQVFEEVEGVLTSVLDGFHVCIFAYGQTGSGKTFTMTGSSSDPGINPRALTCLFEKALERAPSWEYKIEVSALEIYNESVRDLLAPKKGNSQEHALEIRQGPEGVHVPGATRLEAQDLRDVLKVLHHSMAARTTTATGMNEQSSRSHAILLVSVVGSSSDGSQQTHGRLVLVDLAGSERLNRTAVSEALQLKETLAINKSLSALGDVIHALARKAKHVPYRNSALTFLLQDSLSRDAKVIMMVQASPAADDAAESICSLTFAGRARAVEFGPGKKRASGDPLSPGSASKRTPVSARTPPTSPPHASVMSPTRNLPPSAPRTAPFGSGRKNVRNGEPTAAVEGSQGFGRPARSEPVRSNPSPKESIAAQPAAVRVAKTVRIDSSGRYSNPCSPEPEEEGLSLETALSEMQECASPNPMITPTPAKFLVTEPNLEEESGSSAKRQLVFSAEAQTWEGATGLKGGSEPATVASFSEVGVALAEELNLADVDPIALEGADDDLVGGGELALKKGAEENVQREQLSQPVVEMAEEEKAAEDSAERNEGDKDAKREELMDTGTGLPETSQEPEADEKPADSRDDVNLKGALLRNSDAPIEHIEFGALAASNLSSGSPNKPGRSVAKAMGASTTSSQARKKPRPDDDVEIDPARSPTKNSAGDGSITSPAKANISRSAIKSPIQSKVVLSRKVSFKVDGNSLLKSI